MGSKLISKFLNSVEESTVMSPVSSDMFRSDMINLNFESSFVPQYKYIFGSSTVKSEISTKTSHTGLLCFKISFMSLH